MQKIILNLGAALSYALLQWVIITIISREMSVYDAGIYAFYLAIFSPLSILLAFGIRNGIASDSQKIFLDSEYKQLRDIGLIIFILISIFIYIFFNKNNFILLGVIFLKFADLLGEMNYGAWIRKGFTHIYGLSKFFKSFISILVIFIILLLDLGYIYIPFIYFFVSIIFVLLFDNKRTVLINDKRRNGSLKKIIVVTIPLVFSAFLISLNVSIPKFFLSYVSMEEVAIYTMLTYFGSIAIMPVMSIYPIYMSVFSDKSKNNFSIYKKLKIFNFLYISIFVICVLSFGGMFIEEIYKIKNYNYIDIVLTAVLGSIQIFMVWQSFLITSQRDFKTLFLNSIRNSFVLIFLCYILIEKFSLTGALGGVIFSNLILCFLNHLKINKFNFVRD